MSTCIRVFFDNPIATYFTGQIVTGRVVIYLLKEKKCRGIEIRILGEAHVRWTERHTYTRNKRTHTRTVVYSAREFHLDQRIFVVGGPNDEIIFPPGEYAYDFKVVLPLTIPSSFEGDHGYVRYTVKGKVVRPWNFDYESKGAFTVLNILDLNALPSLMDKVQVTKEKYLCCCCCRSGPITFVINVPFTGFVPGQTCQATIEIDNLTTECVTGFVTLYQKVKFMATTKTRTVDKSISTQSLGEVRAKETKTLCSNLLIPPVPVSFLQYSNIIDISYFLQFEGAISGAHMNEKLYVPIVIGTIPLRSQFSSIVPADTPPTAPPDIMDSYPDMPPPSYEECMIGQVDIRSEDDSEHIQGTVEFAPKYPTYHFK